MIKVKYTAQQLLNLDFNSINRMNFKELKQATATLAYTLNARLKKVAQLNKGIKKVRGGFKYSSRTKSFTKAGVKRFKQPKQLNDLREYFNRLNEALGSRLSSVRGIKSIEKSKKQYLNIENERTSKKFWKAYREFEENNDKLKNKIVDSKTVLISLNEWSQEKNLNKSIKRIEEQLDKIVNDLYNKENSVDYINQDKALRIINQGNDNLSLFEQDNETYIVNEFGEIIYRVK